MRAHVPPDVIHVFVASPEEAASYAAVLDEGTFGRIVVGVPELAAQRNFIFRYFPSGSGVLSLNDDVTTILRLKDGALEPVEDLGALADEAFGLLRDRGLSLFGISPTCNPFFMRKRVAEGLYFCIGHMFGFVGDGATQLSVSEKEDYELTLVKYVADGAVLRFDGIACKTRMFAGVGGLQGLSKERRRERHAAAVAELCARFPSLVTATVRKRTGWPKLRLKRSERAVLKFEQGAWSTRTKTTGASS